MSYNTVDPSTGALTPIPGTETSLAPYGAGYGTCSTAAATTAKEATLSGYKLRQNGYVTILFSNEVPASATLNINSKGAKPIFYKGAAIDARVIKAGDRATFIYDGTNYNLIGRDSESSEIQALANDKQDKTLSSAVTIDGATKTTVESAISGIAPVVDKVSKSANEYNTSTSYKKGDYCTHDGKLYRCNTDCSGAWTSNCWDEDTLTNAVNQLNSPFILKSTSTYSTRQSTGGVSNGTTLSKAITLNKDSVVLAIVIGSGNRYVQFGNPTANISMMYPSPGEPGFSLMLMKAGTVVKGTAESSGGSFYITAIPLSELFQTLH